MSDLAKHYAPLTAAEAQLVMRLIDQGVTEGEAVAQVKSERVGPAATWDADFDAGLVNAPEETPEEDPAEPSDEIDLSEPDHDDLDIVFDDEPEETPAEEMWDEAQIAEAGAYELAAYVKAHPDLADLILPIETAREGGGRKTVLDAIESVKEGE